MTEHQKIKSVKLIETVRDTADRLAPKPKVNFVADDSECEHPLVSIYEDVEYQVIEGFGGAFTEAGAVTLDKMSPAKRSEILTAYFDPQNGLGYSLCRTHINSCDFSVSNYAYVEQPGDVALATFSIEHDRGSLIPFIQEARRVSGASFKLLASPWSPPAWMKTNGQMNGGGKLKEEYRETWARYLAKYLKVYAAAGIDIWGMSVQNEPKATQTWDSCVYSAEEERDFVKLYLGPTLEKEGLGHIKIIIWDHNKERLYERAKTAYLDPAAAQYIWGAGFHWYSGDHFDNLEMTHNQFPNKKLIFTEGCQEGGVKLGSWATAERYGHDIIGDLNHWTVAWVDWNMVLDEQGGPNHVGNYCDAPVIADTVQDMVIYESSFYYIGHFSKFIRPGAVRIGHSRYTDQLEVTAFKNIDGTVAVVVMNRTDAAVPYKLRTRHGLADLVSQPHSMTTLLY